MKQALLVVACLVKYKDKFLVIKRAEDPYKGLLSLPGGKIEYYEHPVQAALREVKEETGLDVTFDKMLGVMSEILETSEETRQFVIFITSCIAKTDKFVNSPEGELAWITKNEWLQLKDKFVPSDWQIVKELCFEKNSTLEMREVKICRKEKNGQTSYELQEFKSP